MEYRACVEELLFSSQVQHMKSIRHHPGVSCYEHSVFVSYVAWYLADRWGADARTAARAGLLHDLYLYDPRTLPSYRQCFAHPVAAAENAAALCGGLTAREKNCILAHMWPFLVNTAQPSLNEYNARLNEVYSGRAEDPSFSGQLSRTETANVYGDTVEVGWTEAGYSFTYRILDQTG